MSAKSKQEAPGASGKSSLSVWVPISSVIFLTTSLYSQYVIIHRSPVLGYLALLLPPIVLCLLTRRLALDEASNLLGGIRGSKLLLILGFILLVAILFRTYRLDDIAARLLVDEPIKGIWAVEIAQGASFKPFFHEKEFLFIYLEALFVLLFGANIVTLKLAAVFTGLLSLLAVYFIGRAFFSPIVGLLAAGFFSVMTWAVATNRLAERLNTAPLAVLTFYLSIKQHRQIVKLPSFIIAGASLGFGFYSFANFRPVFLIMLLFFFFFSIIERGFFLKNIAGILIYYATALFALLLPLGFELDKLQTYFLHLAGHETKLFRDLYDMLINLERGLLAFNSKAIGDMSVQPGATGYGGIIHPLLAVLFIYGLIYAIFHLVDKRNFLLFAWFGVSFLPILVSSPEPRRFNLVMPLLCLLAALGAVILGSAIFVKQGWISRVTIGALFVILFAIVSVDNFRAIFFRMYPPSNGIVPHYLAFADYALEQSKYYRVLPTIHPEQAAEFYLIMKKKADRAGVYNLEVNFRNLEEIIPLGSDPEQDVYLVISDFPEFKAELDLIEDYYPEARLKEHRDAKGRLLFYSLFLQRDEITRLIGLECVDLANKDHKARIKGGNIAQELKKSGFLGKTASDIQVTGSIRLPRSGIYRLAVHSTVPYRLRVANYLLTDDDNRTANLRFYKGFYDVELSVNGIAASDELIIELGFPQRADVAAIPSGILFSIPALDNRLKGVIPQQTEQVYRIKDMITPYYPPDKGRLVARDIIPLPYGDGYLCADYSRRLVVKYDNNWNFIAAVDPFDEIKRGFEEPFLMAAGADGRVFVARRDMVVVLGEGLKKRYHKTLNRGVIYDIAAFNNGNLLVLCIANLLLELDASGNVISESRLDNIIPEPVIEPRRLGISAQGILYIYDARRQRIFRLDRDSGYIDSFGNELVRIPGRFSIDDNGNVIYINHDLPGYIYILTPGGSLLTCPREMDETPNIAESLTAKGIDVQIEADFAALVNASFASPRLLFLSGGGEEGLVWELEKVAVQ